MNVILRIVDCCEICSMDHSFNKNEKVGVCRFLRDVKKVSENDSKISKITVCRYFYRDPSKFVKIVDLLA